MKKRHFINGNIAGFSYWSGAEVFDQLKVGTKLLLKREKNNRFDPYAVAIYFKNTKIGFVPRIMNHELSKFLEMGYNNFFETRINSVSPYEKPENQVGFIVHLLQVKPEYN